MGWTVLSASNIKIICSWFTSKGDMLWARFDRAWDVHQFCCASQVLLLVVHGAHGDIARVLVPEVGGKKKPADCNCRVDITDHLDELGESDMLVGSISLQHLSPEGSEDRVGEVELLAEGLHLLPKVFIQHLLEAVLDDVVSSIEGNATTTPPPFGQGGHLLCLPLLGEVAEGGQLVSVHV